MPYRKTAFTVVYFNQRTGTPHDVRRLQQLVFVFKQVFSYFSVTNIKKKGKLHKNIQ